MPSLNNVLFDLDGTIMDPKEGFVKCIQYALNQLGHPLPDENYIANMIGPPLQDTFEELLHSNDIELIKEAVGLYRRRYSKLGLFENAVYPGIIGLFEFLYGNNCNIWVVTFKPVIWTEKIVNHFSLDKWLSGVYGPSLDERLFDKIRLVESVISDTKIAPENTAIVGDRKEDISAGKSNGITTIGVTYGYGSQKEIIDSLPDYICNTPLEVQKVIISHKTK
jgi:phosphoglycolate phosphatase